MTQRLLSLAEARACMTTFIGSIDAPNRDNFLGAIEQLIRSAQAEPGAAPAAGAPGLGQVVCAYCNRPAIAQPVPDHVPILVCPEGHMGGFNVVAGAPGRAAPEQSDAIAFYRSELRVMRSKAASDDDFLTQVASALALRAGQP